MGDGVNDFILDNQSAVQNGAVGVVSIGLEAAERSPLIGAIVQPAVWIIDPNADPDSVDYALYGLGLVGGMVGLAAAATSLIKGMVDDDTRQRLHHVCASEPRRYHRFILPCSDYSGLAGAGINAMTIASKGGTAWKHANGLWVYIVDARGRLVCDYQPSVAVEIYQPYLPLRASGDGFRWHQVRG